MRRVLPIGAVIRLPSGERITATATEEDGVTVLADGRRLTPPPVMERVAYWRDRLRRDRQVADDLALARESGDHDHAARLAEELRALLVDVGGDARP